MKAINETAAMTAGGAHSGDATQSNQMTTVKSRTAFRLSMAVGAVASLGAWTAAAYGAMMVIALLATLAIGATVAALLTDPSVKGGEL